MTQFTAEHGVFSDVNLEINLSSIILIKLYFNP